MAARKQLCQTVSSNEDALHTITGLFDRRARLVVFEARIIYSAHSIFPSVLPDKTQIGVV
jgi:hypothetical protein